MPVSPSPVTTPNCCENAERLDGVFASVNGALALDGRNESSPPKEALTVVWPGSETSGSVAVAVPSAQVVALRVDPPTDPVRLGPASGPEAELRVAVTAASPPKIPFEGADWSVSVVAAGAAVAAAPTRSYEPRLSSSVTRPTPFTDCTMKRSASGEAIDDSVPVQSVESVASRVR